MPDTTPFEKILEEENSFINTAEVNRRGKRDSQRVGLAFSGGGIRSATFNLGVLQALAELGLLERIHYLSTVSGGGYIGAWLAAWIRRCNFQAVRDELKLVGARASTGPPKSSEPTTIRFLRQFSNYLTPRRGAFSVDTWTIGAIYLRNLFLNAATLVAFLVSVLLVPRFVVGAAQAASPGGAAVIGLALVALALTVAGLNLYHYSYGILAHGVEPPWWTRQRWILWMIVVPLWLTAMLWSALPLADAEAWQWVADVAGRRLGRPVEKSTAWAILGAAAYGFAWLPALFLAPARSDSAASARMVSTLRRRVHVLFAFPAGALGGLLVYSLANLFTEWSQERLNFWPGLWLGPPLLLGIFYGISVLHVGLMGSAFDSVKREWRGRLDAWLLITIAIWLGVYGIAIYAPVLVHYAGLVVGEWSEEGLLVGWFGTSVAAIVEGRRGEKTNGRGVGSKLLLSVAPYVFIVGLLVILSTALHRVLAWQSGSPALPSSATTLSAIARDHRVALQDSLWGPVLLVFFAAIVVMVISQRVDINEFSMHHFYRNRLVRAYLGASNRTRANQPFTGLADDDIPISDLDDPNRYCGPYPIINTTLNLTGAKNLAWQQRKAGSFFFTPHQCGYWLQGVGDEPCAFTNTKNFATGNGDKGIGLGTLMAISGAAATPNMGFYSSPALAFLMTVFNVRLGWWVGNPKHVEKCRRLGPEVDFYYWLAELFGNTSEDSYYLYLSDGGHFENLGIYELVRRRCRLIIACDAASDPKRQFADLGNAIEKIRNDMGVDIEIDIGPLTPGDDGRSAWHAVVGRIIYDQTPSSRATKDEGTLIYLKSTLTGDEPTDVLRYAKKHAAFPHQSTGDQWFSESQFESYRALGHHTVQSVFGGMADSHQFAQLPLEELCTRLGERWYPPNPAAAVHFSKHAGRMAELFETLRSEDELDFLDEELYTEFADLQNSKPVARKKTVTTAKQDKSRAAKLRHGFYFCNQLIQLMENVYTDLDLEHTFDHPDNRGWMNTFRRWSWSETFRCTYMVSVSTYGARFQTFCRERLELDVGELHIEEKSLKSKSDSGAVAAALRLNEVIERHRLDQSIERLDGDIRVYVFELEATKQTFFHVGFAVATYAEEDGKSVGTLRYFRIQNQVRKMGLARKALLKLMSDHGIRRYETSPSMTQPTTEPNRVQVTEEEEKRFGLSFQSALREFKDDGDTVPANAG